MKVTGQKIEVETIELDLTQNELTRVVTSGEIPLIDLLRGLTASFKQRIGVHADDIIDDETGVWKHEVEEVGGSHSCYSDVTTREATQNEKVVMETIDDLRTALTITKLS